MNSPKRIQPLTKFTISQIAAGEVIEHPGSIVKELVENSIDSGAKFIEIFIKGGGFESIQVRDDGHGIFKDDLPLAIKSFATSKLNTIDDLCHINSYGFRGEALGAIASVSNILFESKASGSEIAYQLTKQVGEEPKVYPTSLPKGTRIIVSDLFYKLPVRKNFNNNHNKIKKEIIDIISNFSMIHPSIAYHFQYNDKTIINISPSTNLSERIRQLFSQNFLDSLIPVYVEEENKILEGYISGFQFYKSTSDYIRLFINERNIVYKNLLRILKRVYGELMPPKKIPIAILFLKIPPETIDVNVHPQKKEVRFQEENSIDSFFYRALRKSIESHNSLNFKYLTKRKKEHSPSSIKREDESHPFKTSLYISDNINDKHIYSVEANKREKQTNTSGQSTNSSFPKKDISTITHSEATFFSELKLHEKLYELFVVGTSEEGIYLFDQHTIHERVNYEKFLSRLNKNQVIKQELLTPIPLKLSLAEQEIIKQNQSLLSEIGFEIQEIGPGEHGISSIPFYIAKDQEEEALQTCLKQILSSKDKKKININAEILFNELAASLACQASIKKGDPEPLSRIRELIEELKKCKAPMRCPHGRPTMVFLGKQDISTLFKRK